MNKPILISAGVVCVVILAGLFLNQAQPNLMDSNKEQSQQDPQAKEIANNLQNIAKIEGQKIKSINGGLLELENGEKLDLKDTPIKCQVGDIIENYTVANQSLVCIRKDAKGNVISSILMPIGIGIASGLLTNYIASKIFAQNTGLNRMPNSYDYRSNNGDVYNSTYQNQTSSGSNSNNTTRGFTNSTRSGFVGLNNNNSNNGDSKNTSGTKSTGNLSTGSKGGISSGSKGGGGS